MFELTGRQIDTEKNDELAAIDQGTAERSDCTQLL
jgi:hypothetical protein